MTIIAVIGDCTTTVCVALAACWPADDDVLVLEADPAGGSLAAWLDTPSSPSLTTVVANTGAAEVGAAVATVSSMAQRSASGVRFLAAPLRGLPARRAIDEATTTVIPSLAETDAVTVLADLGRRHPGEIPRAFESATLTVVVHRQRPASAAAEAARLERLVEFVEQLGRPIILAVLGTDPFDPAEIVHHVDTSMPGTIADWIRFADDPLAATVLAGRTGVSAKRLRRLPLMRSAAVAAQVLQERAS